MNTGTVETESKDLTITVAILGANIALGTGTLTVENIIANRVINSLTAGGLTLGATTGLELLGKGNIGYLKGATAAGLTIQSNASYTLNSAKDVTLTVCANAVLSIGDDASSGDSVVNTGIISDSELSNVTLNIQAMGKVESVASYLGVGNTINNSGTLVLKGGTLRSDINHGAPIARTANSSHIIIDGAVISHNTINCTLIEFTITDSSVYDQLTLQGVDSALLTEGILLDISNYTLKDGDSFTLLSSDNDWTSGMDGVQLRIEGLNLQIEEFSYDVFNTGTQWGVRFIQIIPEPSTATLSLLALAGLLARRRRRVA